MRQDKPSTHLLHDILRGHKAWPGDKPSAYDILQLFRKTDFNTFIITCTRRAAAEINALAIQVLYEDTHKPCIGTIAADWEANPQNFTEKGLPRSDVRIEPLSLDLYIGMTLHLTRNVQKANDFVNGMAVEVISFHAPSHCLSVKTRTGKILALYPRTEDTNNTRVVCYPVRPGYASTIYKMQGATLPHVTIYLDSPMKPAAAYVAMSRVRKDEDYLIGGRVTRDHFIPAR